MLHKYVLGSEGQIGQFFLRNNPDWNGINRSYFKKWLSEIKYLNSEIHILNVASLSVTDQLLLVACLNERTKKTKLFHFSSISVKNATPNLYSIKKLNEERIFNEFLENQITYKNIRIGIPFGFCAGSWVSFGYWSNIKLCKKNIIICTKDITFDFIDRSIVGQLKTAENLAFEEYIRSKVWRILPVGKFVQRLPIRRLNSVLGKIGIYIFR